MQSESRHLVAFPPTDPSDYFSCLASLGGSPRRCRGSACARANIARRGEKPAESLFVPSLTGCRGSEWWHALVWRSVVCTAVVVSANGEWVPAAGSEPGPAVFSAAAG